MSPSQHPRPATASLIHRSIVIVVISLYLATRAFGRRYDEDDEDLFARLLEQRSSLPRIKDHDFSYLLNNLNLGTPAKNRFLPETNGFGMPRLPEQFPRLGLDQRQFAVNPGYMSYYNPEYEHIENDKELAEASKMGKLTAEPKEDNNSEVVEDPFDQGKANSGQTIKAGQPPPPVLTISPESLPAIVAVSSAAMAFFVLGVAFCYHRVKRNAKAAEDVEYPAYGVTGPCKDTSPTLGADRKLAQNAQMYHYQHQKRQMIAFDNGHHQDNIRGIVQPTGLGSDDESEDDGEEGDFTVYECPGLAPAGEMEVRNPMFADETTPKATSKK